MSAATVAMVAPSLEILGGQGVQAAALAEGLRADGYAVDFIPINPGFPRGLGWLRRQPYVRTVVNQALFLPGLHRIRPAHVAHVFSASYWSFLLAPASAMLAARSLGKRVVLHYHSGEAEDHLAHWGPLVHPWLRLAHEIVVPSAYLGEVFARHGYRARVIPNVVDTSAFRFRARRPLRARLLSTRNFEPHYAVENTLEAFALLRERRPEATLVLAGYGSLEPRLRRRAAELGAQGLEFRGRVAPRDMPSLCDEADLFVNSSVVDNQPVSILEAFASGLPVVSTGTGDIARMVSHGTTGTLVPPRDPPAMAAAVAALLDDPDRALRMAARARREAEGCSWAHVREAWAEVYGSAPAAGRRSA